MGLELRHLRSVCAIADAGSVTRAATVLGVSQQVLTARLQRVERELGGRLFERDRDGVTPTPLGEFLLTRARGVLLGMEELRRSTGRHVCAERPLVTLGGVACAVSVGLADRVSDLLPGVEVRLRAEYSPRALWDLLLADRIDAAAVVDYPGFPLNTPSTVVSDVIAVEPVFVAMSDRHPLAGRDEVALAELAGERWALTPQDGAGWPDCFYVACHQAGFTPRVLYSVSDAVPQRDIVATRRAVSPCQAVFPTGDGVVVKPLAGNPLHMRHLLVCRGESLLADSFDDLLRLAREAYHAYAGRRPHYQSWLSQSSR
ncbi:LysR family transcriptional regulator [Actinokineospora sp. UTMC 2448]|uniref:LysR substrate-binding domain-containing protein n=1 Tax=Actinokineospora sp. UTMC 2448 TaxID=2268449 RepID=UPI0021649426|nr:LysR family transcriptional regulator [Actinokineospora sp. UTMC 2448]UVS79094.1 HTH-type transcriptional regulator GltC [Actinokineospora sp. UTMC 2448]